MYSIARYLVIVTVFLSNFAGSQEHLTDEANTGKEDKPHQELQTSCQHVRPIVGWVEHNWSVSLYLLLIYNYELSYRITLGLS